MATGKVKFYLEAARACNKGEGLLLSEQDVKDWHKYINTPISAFFSQIRDKEGSKMSSRKIDNEYLIIKLR